MPRERTLLERFNDPRPGEPLRTTQNTEMLAKSVLQHLSKVLNTRRGHSLTQPEDYGMTDLTELIHGFPESIKEVQQAIRTTIEKYEPRLRNVDVEYVKSDEDVLTLRFKITAQIATERQGAPVWFETVVAPSGQVELKG